MGSYVVVIMEEVSNGKVLRGVIGPFSSQENAVSFAKGKQAEGFEALATRLGSP